MPRNEMLVARVSEAEEIRVRIAADLRDEPKSALIRRAVLSEAQSVIEDVRKQRERED